MDLKYLIILITAFTDSMAATYVLFNNPKKIVNIAFSLFTFSASLWSLALFIIAIAKDYQMLVFAGHVAFLGGALMACNFLLFAYVFPQGGDEIPPKKVLLAIYVPGALAAIAACTPFVMVGITYSDHGVRPVYGKGILLHTFYALAFSGYGLILLARKYLSHPGRFERVQLRYVFWSLLVSALGIALCALVLPVVGISRYSTPMTPLVTLVATAGMAYAIVRHRLMDLGIVFRNVLIYTSIAVVMAVTLIGLVLALEPILHISPWSMVFLAATCAAVMVQPLRYTMARLVDKYYFRGRYDYQTTLAEFSSTMARILDLDDLQNRIVHEVASTLQVKSAAILLFDPAEHKYTVRASIPVTLGNTCGEIEPTNVIVGRLGRERSPLVKEELKRLLSNAEFEPLKQEFERMDAEVFIPLIYRSELIGLLTLGEKKSLDIYSVEDLNLLATLGNQAAVALENALLHHTVTMLKDHNENILKYMSSGVIAIDGKQTINTCNEKAREILRLDSQNIINRKIDVLPAPLREMLAQTLSGKSRYSNQEVQLLSDRGAISYLSASTSLIRDEKGGVTGALLVVNDLTEIRLLQAEMWRADKLASLGTLAAGMAHEIKNPLVSIKTFAQLLPTRYEDKDFRDTFSSIAVDEVERINSIVEKLLEFARPSAPLFESADVIEIIEEVLLLLSTETAKLGVAVTKNFEAPSVPVICDKGRIKQALLNLCLNSLQAIASDAKHKGGELKISVGLRKSRYQGLEGLPRDQISQMFYGTDVTATIDDAETVIIKVRDSGPGISRKDLTKIFDPFFTTKEKGVGLGLAVVHGIIKEHSGNISVDSKLGEGTEFAISLPVTQIFAKERA